MSPVPPSSGTPHRSEAIFSSPAVGIVYTVLAGILFVLAYFRQRHSRHDFSDKNREAAYYANAMQTVGQAGKRIFGRPFVTAGWVVALLSLVVFIVEVGLLVLIFQI